MSEWKCSAERKIGWWIGMVCSGGCGGADKPPFVKSRWWRHESQVGVRTANKAGTDPDLNLTHSLGRFLLAHVLQFLIFENKSEMKLKSFVSWLERWGFSHSMHLLMDLLTGTCVPFGFLSFSCMFNMPFFFMYLFLNCNQRAVPSLPNTRTDWYWHRLRSPSRPGCPVLTHWHYWNARL